ncbi:MAG: hypothetical protein Q7S52_00730 [bacterium]|nr:hypothetical protein [bacterium]
METEQITLMMDGRIPITVDKEVFELVKLMVEEMGAVEDLKKTVDVVRRFIAENQQYADRKGQVISLVVLARRDLKEERATR